MSEQTQIYFTQADRHDAQIEALLRGDATLGLRPTLEQEKILRSLRFHKGAGNAIKIRDLMRVAGVTEREVKETIAALRMSFGMLIGSSKSSKDGGYYLILTDEEREQSAALPADEIRARAQWLRVLKGKHYVLEMLGQLQIEVQQIGER